MPEDLNLEILKSVEKNYLIDYTYGKEFMSIPGLNIPSCSKNIENIMKTDAILTDLLLPEVLLKMLAKKHNLTREEAIEKFYSNQ